MTINIYINSIYSCHIAYLAFLLKLDFNIISTDPKTFNFLVEYQPYKRMVDQVVTENNYLIETTFFEYFIKNQFTFYTSPPAPGTTITILNNSSLLDAQLDFLTQLDTLNIIKYLYQYETNLISYKKSIQWVIETILNRTATVSEIDYYYYHNRFSLNSLIPEKFINLFTFIHIIYFSSEARSNNLHMPFVTVFKNIKYTNTLINPTFALLLSGHSRQFYEHSSTHKDIIQNPYIDIFIHTWSNKGPRYEFSNSLTDIFLLTSTYQPKDISVENEHIYKNDFSLIGKINPIFLIWGQQTNDGSRYVNSKLYSLWKALTLMQTFETNNNITYHGIIKGNFNLDIINFDFVKVAKNISPNICGTPRNALYVPVNFKRASPDIFPYIGACKTCDRQLTENCLFNYIPNHSNHTNDIVQNWWYTNRTIGKKAAELYLEGSNILFANHSNNVARYSAQLYKQNADFIYMREADYYQSQFISVNDQPKDMICFYPERLLREHLKNYCILSSDAISGTFRDFDIYTDKI